MAEETGGVEGFEVPTISEEKVKLETEKKVEDTFDVKLDDLLSVAATARHRALYSEDVEAQKKKTEEELLEIPELPVTSSAVIPWHASQLGVTPQVLLDEAKRQDLGDLEDLVRSVTIKGMSPEEVKEQAGRSVREGGRGLIGFIPEHQRETIKRGETIKQAAASREIAQEAISKGFKPASPEYQELVGRATEKFFGPPTVGDFVVSAAKSGIMGTESIKAPEVLKPGDAAYNRVVLAEFQRRADDPGSAPLVESIEAYSRDLLGWEQFQDDYVAREMRAYAGKDLNATEREELEHKFAKDALRDIALRKTANQWSAPVIVPFVFDEQTGSLRIPKSDEKSLPQALMPAFEIIGVDKEGRVVVRQESALAYAFALIDLPEKFLAGLFTKKEGENIGEAMVRGAAERRNFWQSMVESEAAQSHGYLTSVPLGTIGFLASVFTPDLLTGFGAVQLKRRGARIFDYVKSREEAEGVATSARSVAEKFLSADKEVLDDAWRAEAAISEAHKGYIEDVHRAEEIIASRYDIHNPSIRSEAVKLDAQLPGELRGQYIHANASTHRAQVAVDTAAPGRRGTEDVSFATTPKKDLYNFGAHLRRLESIKQRLTGPLEGRDIRLLDTMFSRREDTQAAIGSLVRRVKDEDAAALLKTFLSREGYADLLTNTDDALKRIKEIIGPVTSPKRQKKIDKSLESLKESVTKFKATEVTEANFDEVARLISKVEESVKTNKEIRAAAHLVTQDALLRWFGKNPVELKGQLANLVEGVREIEDLTSEALRVSNALESAYNVPRKLSVVVAAIVDARARTWAAHTGRDPSDWYRTRLKIRTRALKEEPDEGPVPPAAPPKPDEPKPQPKPEEPPPMPPKVADAPPRQPLPDVPSRPLTDSKGNPIYFGSDDNLNLRREVLRQSLELPKVKKILQDQGISDEYIESIIDGSSSGSFLKLITAQTPEQLQEVADFVDKMRWGSRYGIRSSFFASTLDEVIQLGQKHGFERTAKRLKSLYEERDHPAGIIELRSSPSRPLPESDVTAEFLDSAIKGAEDAIKALESVLHRLKPLVNEDSKLIRGLRRRLHNLQLDRNKFLVRAADIRAFESLDEDALNKARKLLADVEVPLSPKELWDHIGSGRKGSRAIHASNARSIIDWMAQHGGFSLTRAIASRIAPLIDEGYTFRVLRNPPHKKFVSLGEHNQDLKTIEIKGPGYWSTGLTEEVIIHEFIHAATVSEIRRVRESRRGYFTGTPPSPAAIAAVDNLEDFGKRFLDYAKKQIEEGPPRSEWRFLPKEEVARLYHFDFLLGPRVFARYDGPALEIVTYSLTDPDTIKLLRSISLRDLGYDAPPKMSVWDRFVQLIGRILGVAEEDQTALNYALSETGALLKTIDPETADLVSALRSQAGPYAPTLSTRMPGDLIADTVDDLDIADLGDGLISLTSQAMRDLDTTQDIGLVFRVKEGDKTLSFDRFMVKATNQEDFADGVIEIQSANLPESMRGQGIGTQMYLQAIEAAQANGLGLRSDLNPSNEAGVLYDRLRRAGLPVQSERIAPPPGTVDEIPFGEPGDYRYFIAADDLAGTDLAAIRKEVDRIAAEDSAKLDEAMGASGVRRGPGEPPIEDPRRVTQTDDGFTILQAFEGDDIDDALRGIARVLRRDLTEDDLSLVTSWLRTVDPALAKLRHRGGAFVDVSDELLERAEDLFSDAFIQYLREGTAPTTKLEQAFARLKELAVRVYAAIRGREVSINDDMRKVFDNLLGAQEVSESDMLPRMAKIVRDEMVGPPKSRRTGVMRQIIEELRRRGVADLKTVEELFEEFDSTKKIELPKPIFGEYLEEGKTVLTEDDLTKVQDMMENEILRVRDTPDRAGMPYLLNKTETIAELDPSEQLLASYGTGDGEKVMAAFGRSPKFRDKLRVVATFMWFGGDAYQDLRLFPPTIRQNIMTGVRPITQTIGETIALAQEGSLTKFIAYLSGKPVKLESGRDLVSSGEDYILHVNEVVNKMYRNLTSNEQAALASDEAARLFMDAQYWSTTKATPARYQPYVTIEGEKISLLNAFAKMFGEPGNAQSGLGGQLRSALGIAGSDTFVYQEIQSLEALLYHAGIVQRRVKGNKFAKVAEDAPSEVRSEKLIEDWDKIYGREDKGGVSTKVTHAILVLAGHGAAEISRNRLSRLGIIEDTRIVNEFKKWVAGVEIDETVRPQVIDFARRMGIQADMIEDTYVLSAGQYIPAAVQKRISDSLARLDVKGDSNLAQFGKGVERYLKIKMTRGWLLPRLRYFTMNTFDHFTQLSMTIGFGPAWRSVMRLLPQNLLTIPGVAQSIKLAQISGVLGPDQMEILRQSLQRGGERVSRFMSAAKWRLDVNPVLEGRAGTVRLGDGVYSYQDIRRIAVEEGLFASFDTRVLERAIRSDIEEFFDRGGKEFKSSFDSAQDFFRAVETITAEVAETWSERERLGAMITLIEAGMPPREAARVSIKALYDYAGSMSKLDRNWLVSLVLPFWAFQKNANKHVFDTMFSPWGAYRMGVYRRMQERTTDVASYAFYGSAVDPYGVDVEALPPEARDNYYYLRAQVEDMFGSPEKVPDDVRKAMYMIFRGRSRVLEDGKVYELNEALQRHREFMISSEYSRRRPVISDVPSYLRDRLMFKLPLPVNENSNRLLGLMSGDEMWEAVMIPESTVYAGMRHLTYSLVAMTKMAEGIGTPIWEAATKDTFDTDIEYTLKPTIKTVMENVFPVDRSPILAPIMDLAGWTKSDSPRRISKHLYPLISSLSVPTFRSRENSDPLLANSLESQGLDPNTVKKLSSSKLDAYYITPGVYQLLFELFPGLGEVNNLMLQLEVSPVEKAAGLQGDIVYLLRNVVGLQTADVLQSKTVSREEPRTLEETRNLPR